MIWSDIQGWFTFESLYIDIVLGSKDNDIFVEVGTWLGRSTAFLADQIKQSNKKIILDVVDTFLGSPGEPEHLKIVKKHGGSIKESFVQNMKDCDVFNIIRNIHDISSTDAANKYDNGSLAFVLVDASHSYNDVMKDLNAWWPKIAIGGTFAGHDWVWKSVRNAVKEKFDGKQIQTDGGCWIVKKET